MTLTSPRKVRNSKPRKSRSRALEAPRQAGRLRRPALKREGSKLAASWPIQGPLRHLEMFGSWPDGTGLRALAPDLTAQYSD
eukprot:15480828-Alexandrium_andersonii.AAC.1